VKEVDFNFDEDSPITYESVLITNKILEAVADELTERIVAVRRLSEVALKLLPSEDIAVPVFQSIVKILSEDIQTKLWGVGEDDE
tara:strand:+ start:329 stop:583 length:255 start_codon:yes stop_codon:yes gene_type:complete